MKGSEPSNSVNTKGWGRIISTNSCENFINSNLVVNLSMEYFFKTTAISISLFSFCLLLVLEPKSIILSNGKPALINKL